MVVAIHWNNSLLVGGWYGRRHRRDVLICHCIKSLHKRMMDNFKILRQIAEGPGVSEVRVRLKLTEEGGPFFDEIGDLADYLRKNAFDDERLELQEQVVAALFDYDGKLIASVEISLGSRRECQVPFAPIIRAAALANATGVVLVHNHPQGALNPSDEDVDLAVSLSHSLRLAGFSLEDFVIINRKSYKSLVELRLL